MGHDHAEDDDWDGLAEWYDGVVDLVEPELAKATAAMLDAVGVVPGMRLLDLGCGPGHTTAAAAARGAVATGLDLSPNMIAIARRRFPDSTFIEGDMTAPPEGPWDAVVSRLGAHHAPPAWAAAIHHVMAPGGSLALVEMESDEPEDPRGMRPTEHWTRLLEGAGWQDVEVRELDIDLEAALADVPPMPDHDEHHMDGPVVLITASAGTKA